jgi:hypothetical protein
MKQRFHGNLCGYFTPILSKHSSDGSSDDEVSSRLIVMAQEYKARADAIEAEAGSPLPAMVISSDRKPPWM